MQQTTLPVRFFSNARRLSSRIAHHYAAHGEWFPVGWGTMASVVHGLASGLIAMGHEPSDAVAILASTRREWLYCDMAVLSAGGISVGLYPGMDAQTCTRILADSGARFCVVEDRAQLAKLEPALDALPDLRMVVVMDPQQGPPDALARLSVASRPLDDRPGSRIVSYAELLRRGRMATYEVDRRLSALSPLDAATFLYTSGTTGVPKCAMLTHGNITAAMDALEALGLSAEDVSLSALPLAHGLQRAMDYYGLWIGMHSAYGRGMHLLAEDMAEVRPTVLATVPYVLERLYAEFHRDLTRTSAGERVLGWVREIGRQVTRQRRFSLELAPGLQAQLRLMRKLVLGKLREHLGGRLRRVLLMGAPAGRELVELLEVAGIEVLEGWGMTESLAFAAACRVDSRRVGSVGMPLPGVDLALADDGELLMRGASLFSGYHRDQAATVASLDQSGFFRTGDLACVDEDGFYYIAGRKRDVITLSTGQRISPQALETFVRADPRMSHVVLVGQGRPYLTALVAVPESTRAELGESETVQMIEGVLAARNLDLMRTEQIRAFRLLPHDLGEASGELTPAMQVKRHVVMVKFGYLIDEMYE